MKIDYTTHPNPEKRKAQSEFLDRCPPEEKRFHELMFMFGNVTYRYHHEAKGYKPSMEDWREWISGLNEPIKSDMEKRGFEQGRSILAFTRYVMEKNDVGLEEYLKQHIDSKDFEELMRIRTRKI